MNMTFMLIGGVWGDIQLHVQKITGDAWVLIYNEHKEPVSLPRFRVPHILYCHGTFHQIFMRDGYVHVSGVKDLHVLQSSV